MTLGPLDPLRFADNGIGLFKIGASPIGTRPNLNLNETILSQYTASPKLLALIGDFEEWYDPTEVIDAFYDQVWNVDTAVGWGLDVWGRIVGLETGRILTVGGDYLGWKEAGPFGPEPFYQAPWYLSPTTTNNVALTDPAFRQLILAKAASNICDGSIPGINQVLLRLFDGRGSCFARDLGGMQMQYVFNFTLTPLDLAIITQTGILPKPVGVQLSYIVEPFP
jgi:hypothetical protein